MNEVRELLGEIRDLLNANLEMAKEFREAALARQQANDNVTRLAREEGGGTSFSRATEQPGPRISEESVGILDLRWNPCSTCRVCGMRDSIYFLAVVVARYQ
jgi:hypothetical protein